MEELSFDNILGESQIENLFTYQDDAQANGQERQGDPGDDSPEEPQKQEEDTAETINPDELFVDEKSESVGSGKSNEANREQEDADLPASDGTSPNNRFYSSIAKALREEGIFPDLDDELIEKASGPEEFRDLVEAQIKAGLDERQRRVDAALNNGVEPSDIRKFEGTLKYLSSIKEADVMAETEDGERLRRNLIYQDYLNRGFTQEKALKFTERTVENGTDVEDAKEALASNREYFKEGYDKLLKEAQEEADKERAEREAKAAKVKDSIMKDRGLLGDIELDASLRKKAFDTIYKPVYKDPETGDYYTELQKYERDNHEDFMKYVGLIYTLTNGFKDFDGFTKGKVKKEVKKGLRELEHTLNSTRRNANGNLALVTGVTDDPESFIGKGVKLDF